jgi:hypothetical protein
MPENANRRAHLYAHLAAGARRRCRTCAERAAGLPPCSVCDQPMVTYEPDRIAHPGCDPEPT